MFHCLSRVRNCSSLQFSSRRYPWVQKRPYLCASPLLSEKVPADVNWLSPTFHGASETVPMFQTVLNCNSFSQWGCKFPLVKITRLESDIDYTQKGSFMTIDFSFLCVCLLAKKKKKKIVWGRGRGIIDIWFDFALEFLFSTAYKCSSLC